jgi:hypothetical protein
MYEEYFKGIYLDNGCKDAKNFIGRSVKCANCPFGDCVADLKPAEKQLILRQSDAVQTVLMYCDLGMSTREIELLIPSVTQSQVQYWVRQRDKIIPKIKRFAPIGVK